MRGFKLKNMEFFDYVYYKLCQFYDRSKKGSGAGLSGLASLSLLQLLNLISILALLFQLSHYYIYINKSWFVIPAFALIVLNGIRYNKLNYAVLRERWKNENEITKKKSKRYVFMYVTSTIMVAIAVIIWRSNN